MTEGTLMRPGRTGILPEVLLSCVAASLLAASASAQFDLSRVPGAEAPSLTVEADRAEALRRAIEESRWRLGALRLHPWLAIKDSAYINNIYATDDDNAESDFTATFGLGLRGYVPLGEHAAFALHALPEYVWWQETEERRQLNGRYGAGVFVYGTRLGFELAATRDEQQGVVTPEFQQWSSSRRDSVNGSLDVSLYRSLGLFVRSSYREYRYLLGDEAQNPLTAPFDQLDRDETLIAAGFRLQLGEPVRIALGYEHSEVSFDEAARDRSNTGDSPFLELLVDGAIRATAKLAYRELEARDQGSQFVAYSEPTGSLYLTFLPKRRVSFDLYGVRNLVYALTTDAAYFIDDAYGAGLSVALGKRTSLRPYFEAGEHRYSGSDRKDDTTAWGVQLDIKLGLGTRLVLAAGEAHYDSNQDDALDRKVSTLGLGIRFGEIAWP